MFRVSSLWGPIFSTVTTARGTTKGGDEYTLRRFGLQCAVTSMERVAKAPAVGHTRRALDRTGTNSPCDSVTFNLCYTPHPAAPPSGVAAPPSSPAAAPPGIFPLSPSASPPCGISSSPSPLLPLFFLPNPSTFNPHVSTAAAAAAADNRF